MTLRHRRARCAGRQHELQPDAPAAPAAKVPGRDWRRDPCMAMAETGLRG
jgi:hypothetical protein